MLVLSNGEKVRPVAMEAIINSHPAVSSCLMVSITCGSLGISIASIPTHSLPYGMNQSNVVADEVDRLERATQ